MTQITQMRADAYASRARPYLCRSGALRGAGAALALLLCAALACQTVPLTPAPSVALAVGASTSAQPLLVDAMAAYRASTEGGRVTFAPEYGNSQLIVDGLRDGRFAGALVTWPASDPPEGMWMQPVAMDALAVIVHQDNPLTALSLPELREIFQGRTNLWPAPPGGEPAPIEVVVREDGSVSRTLFERRVMGDQKVSLVAVIMPGSQAVVDYVATHPAAIGYVSLGWVDARVRALALDGVAPSPETARNQTYPLLAPVCFLSQAEPQDELRAFYLYLIGPEGQRVVAQKYGPVR
jgi:phosphate transport system substrate-binding protein